MMRHEIPKGRTPPDWVYLCRDREIRKRVGGKIGVVGESGGTR